MNLPNSYFSVRRGCALSDASLVKSNTGSSVQYLTVIWALECREYKRVL